VDENLNVEVQLLLDSFYHLKEKNWKDQIDKFLLYDHLPMSLEFSNTIEEKASVSSNLEPDPRILKCKGNLNLAYHFNFHHVILSKLEQLSNNLVGHQDDFIHIIHHEPRGVPHAYGKIPSCSDYWFTM